MMRYLFDVFVSKKVEILIGFLLFVVLFNNQVANIVLFFLFLTLVSDKRSYQFKLTNAVIITIVFFLYLILRESFHFEKKGIDYIVRLIPILLLAISLGLYEFRYCQIKFITHALILINYIFYISAIFFGIYLYLLNSSNNVLLDFSYYQWVVAVKFDFHPPYWGVFIVLSFIVVIRNKTVPNLKKIIFGIFTFFFLFLLSSRTAILAIISVVLLEFICNRLIKKRAKIFMLVSFVIAILALSLYPSYLSKKITDNSGFQERVRLWSSAYEAFEENYLVGSSVPQGESLIRQFYNFKDAEKKNFDPHNQFLFFIVNYGIIGLSLFLVLLFYRESYSLAFIMFLIATVLSFTTESVLNRQMGVIIFAVFLNIINNSSFNKIATLKT
ncbi:O-antigen ligase family protein [Mariniflexile ostreae]|uniref:O-antigen ligase family protein n=1 Tax=Mariniflexile ostreae TaxID=1520892 RepID=A0ABV5F794_9FLAO